MSGEKMSNQEGQTMAELAVTGLQGTKDLAVRGQKECSLIFVVNSHFCHWLGDSRGRS